MNNTNNLKYSKLNIHKSRSLDFSDLSDWFSQTPKSIRKLSLNIRNNNNVVKPKPRRTSRTVDQTSTTSTTSTTTQTQIDPKKTDIRSISSTSRHHKDDSMNMDSSSPMKLGDDEQEADQPDIAHHHLHEVAVVGSKGGDSSTSTAAAHARPVLRRNGSVSVSVSVKTRVLSMRRSSSVNSERYCRIHDQQVTLASPIDDVDEMNEDEIFSHHDAEKQKQKKKGGAGKILKVCKRFFGL